MANLKDILKLLNRAQAEDGAIKVGLSIDELDTHSDQLPEALSASGNLKTAIVESLPAGSALIGKVESDTLGDPTDDKNSATDATAVTIVSLLKQISFKAQSPNSRNVTNTGTFAVQPDPVQAVISVTIADTENESTEIDFRKYKYMAIQTPAEMDGVTMWLDGSATQGGTKIPIWNDDGEPMKNFSFDTNKIYTIDVDALKIASVPFLAIKTNEVQTAERTIQVMLKG